MKYQAEYYLHNAQQASLVMYREGVAEDRLAFRVGMLEGYIRQLCMKLNELEEFCANGELEILNLKTQLIEKDL